MIRTHMQKGMGATTFAIVAALIIALAAGFWVTQKAQAADGDVVLAVAPITAASGFATPSGDNARSYGPADRVFELRDPTTDDEAETAEATPGRPALVLEQAYADASPDNLVRGEIGRGAKSWVEFRATVRNVTGTGADAVEDDLGTPVNLLITVSGEASLSSSATVSSSPCLTRDLDGVEDGAFGCAFAVYTNGTPGSFTVTAGPAAGTDLVTIAQVKKAASKHGQWVGPAVAATVLSNYPDSTGVGTYATKQATAVDSALGIVADSYYFIDDDGEWVRLDETTGSGLRDGAAIASDTTGTGDDEKATGLPDAPTPDIWTRLAEDGEFQRDTATKLSPTNFQAAAIADQVFLFQLTDVAGQVALNTTDSSRDDVRIRVTTAGDATDFDIAGDSDGAVGAVVVGLSNQGSAGDQVYVDILQESGLRATAATEQDYPTAPVVEQNATGGLIAVALTQGTTPSGGMGSICVDVDANGTCEVTHDFTASGPVDGKMSSVGPITEGPVNMGEGQAHVRVITLRDKNGVPVSGAGDKVRVANVKDANLGFATDTDAAKAKAKAIAGISDDPETADVDETAPSPTTLDAVQGKDGQYFLGITALTKTEGLHEFTVTIGTGTARDKKTTDSAGDLLAARIAAGIAANGISITSVTAGQSDENLLPANGTATVTVDATTRLLTIVLATEGAGGDPPPSGTPINVVSTTGRFIGTVTEGSGDTARPVVKTDDNGEASVRYVFGAVAVNATLFFGSGDNEEVLLINVAADEPDEQVDTGPRIYPLASQAGGDFHNWTGGVASSSEFENVANLVAVWKWTGGMWVGYVSAPNAPAATKTNYSLQDGDTLFVVANGPVDLTLD